MAKANLHRVKAASSRVRGEGEKRGQETRESARKTEGRGRNRDKSYHAAEHFVLVVGEEQHHVGPPRARRHPGDPQAAAQQKQQ